MPYKFEINKIKLPKDKDRRRHLTDNDKIIIRQLYRDGVAIRKIARCFGHKVCRRSIQFVLFPKRIKKARENYNWRNYYDKNKHAKAMKEYRHYKQKVLGKVAK